MFRGGWRRALEAARAKVVVKSPLAVSLMFPPDLDFKTIAAGDGVLHGDGIADFHHTAPLAEIVPERAGLNVHGQLTKGGFV